MHANKEADITLEALEGLNKGELLQVSTDCPGSSRSVPEEAIAHG